MADFWIKVEKSTPDKPEIFEISQILDIDPDAVMGKLIRVWCWADSNSEDGHIKSVTNVLIDRLTMTQGFADAMKIVGWLQDGEIPNYDRHLGKSAKKRANDAQRKRKSRNESQVCHDESVTKKGLDKSREDKNNTTAKPKYTSDDLKCAEYVVKQVKKNNPEAKIYAEKQAEIINKIVRLDNKTHHEICQLFGLIADDVRDGFCWAKNCRSAAKLRDSKDGLTYFNIIGDQLGAKHTRARDNVSPLAPVKENPIQPKKQRTEEQLVEGRARIAAMKRDMDL